MNENILTRKQTAEFLGICLTTLDKLQIKKIKVDRLVRYRKDDILQYLETNSIEGANNENPNN